MKILEKSSISRLSQFMRFVFDHIKVFLIVFGNINQFVWKILPVLLIVCVIDITAQKPEILKIFVEAGYGKATELKK